MSAAPSIPEPAGKSLLIDTTVISEVRKGDRCHPQVARWYASVDAADLFLSVLVIGEIRRGAEAIQPRP